jgi:hypothetical protein
MNSITRPILRHSMRDLEVVFFGNGWTRWHYVARPDQRTGTAHTLADVMSPGYFADIASKMIEGDFIDVSAHDGGGTLYVTEIRHSPDWVRTVPMCCTAPGSV